MPSKNKTKYIGLYSFHVPVLVLAVAIIGIGAVASVTTSNNPNGSSILGSKAKNDNAKKSLKTTEGETPTAKQHKKIITQVVTKLEEVSKTEKGAGNKEVGEEIAEVAETEEEIAAETVEAIDAVESKPKWQVLLFGSDYKNLGQLRSSLAHNTNSIRKLTRNTASVTESSSSAQVQSQLSVLELERERILNVIRTNEDQFSILGWVSRLLNKYPTQPIGGGDDTDTNESSGSADL